MITKIIVIILVAGLLYLGYWADQKAKKRIFDEAQKRKAAIREELKQWRGDR